VCAKTYATWANIVKTIVQLVPRNQFTLMQEQAKAELEKIQAAKDKKEQKEQEKVEKAKAKEEKKREREEKKLKEAAQAEKAKKAAGKQKKAPGSEKGDGKVPEDMETQPATPPKTPKRAAALVATPRQKNMVKRRRQNVAADGQYAPSGSTPNVPGDGGNHKDAKELALLEKSRPIISF
jgi:DNA polymerase III gamma/tau subunit